MSDLILFFISKEPEGKRLLFLTGKPCLQHPACRKGQCHAGSFMNRSGSAQLSCLEIIASAPCTETRLQRTAADTSRRTMTFLGEQRAAVGQSIPSSGISVRHSILERKSSQEQTVPSPAQTSLFSLTSTPGLYLSNTHIKCAFPIAAGRAAWSCICQQAAKDGKRKIKCN